MPFSSWLPRRRRDSVRASLALEEVVTAALNRRNPDEMLGIRLVLEKNAGSTRAGAEVASVDVDGVAWRAGVEVGDLITTVIVPSASDHPTIYQVQDAYETFDVLQATASGTVELRLRRRKWLATDYAARTIQTAWRGKAARLSLAGHAHAASWLRCSQEPGSPGSPLAPPRLSSSSSRISGADIISGEDGPCFPPSPLAPPRLSSSSRLSGVERSNRSSFNVADTEVDEAATDDDELAASAALALQAAWRGKLTRLELSERWSDCMSSAGGSPLPSPRLPVSQS